MRDIRILLQVKDKSDKWVTDFMQCFDTDVFHFEYRKFKEDVVGNRYVYMGGDVTCTAPLGSIELEE